VGGTAWQGGSEKSNVLFLCYFSTILIETIIQKISCP